MSLPLNTVAAEPLQPEYTIITGSLFCQGDKLTDNLSFSYTVMGNHMVEMSPAGGVPFTSNTSPVLQLFIKKGMSLSQVPITTFTLLSQGPPGHYKPRKRTTSSQCLMSSHLTLGLLKKCLLRMLTKNTHSFFISAACPKCQLSLTWLRILY